MSAFPTSGKTIGTMSAAMPFTFRNVSVCVTVVVPSGPAASSNTLR